jgi:RND family efflux transporter MFP subunit
MCNMDVKRIVPRITVFLLVMNILAPMPGGASGPAASQVVLESKGYLLPSRQVTISPKVRGQVVELLIEEGKHVKAGEVLARLDPDEHKLALRLAVAKLKLANAGLAKAKKEERKADLVTAEAKVEVAQAEIAIAEYHLECTNVRAPFDGTVLVKHAEVGTLIDPKAFQVPANLCVLADLRTMEVEVWVPERDLAKVAKGQTCLILLEAFPETKYRGRVAQLPQSADRARNSVPIRVRMEVPEEEKRLRPELGAIVQILDKE